VAVYRRMASLPKVSGRAAELDSASIGRNR
jgi:hypothetical protein